MARCADSCPTVDPNTDVSVFRRSCLGAVDTHTDAQLLTLRPIVRSKFALALKGCAGGSLCPPECDEKRVALSVYLVPAVPNKHRSQNASVARKCVAILIGTEIPE